MKGGEDPDNRRDFPGGFPGDARDGFTQAGRTAEQQAEFAWISGLARLRREHAALECGGEQVLAANADWLVILRDMRHQRAERCEAQGKDQSKRVIVALHRGSGSGMLDVPTDQTWAQDCKVSQPLLGKGQVSASNAGIHLSLNGNDVLIAACE
jgi:hypothetical protein